VIMVNVDVALIFKIYGLAAEIAKAALLGE
jgi:hypothetical protein